VVNTKLAGMEPVFIGNVAQPTVQESDRLHNRVERGIERDLKVGASSSAVGVASPFGGEGVPFRPPQQNLWVPSGSGRFPSV
jgi:hypothetical protein